MAKGESNQRPLALILFLFFISGALALTYQVVWSRMMMNLLGSTAIAVGTVLAAFMTGLAIGSWKVGKIADRHSNCLRLYAILEIGIAFAALGSHLLLNRMGLAHSPVFAWMASSAASFDFARFIIAFLLVVAPTVLMGATLPVLSKFLISRKESVGNKLSTLFATNTIGAVTGVLLTGFFLIGRYGIHLPVYMAVVGNFIIGLVALFVSFRTSASSAPLAAERDPKASQTIVESNQPGPLLVRVILFGLALSGFTSFAYEIYWTRSLVFILGNSTYALSTMLSAFLTGIALGSYLVRFLINRFTDASVIFGWTQVLLGIFSAMALPILFSIADPRALGQYMLETSDQIVPLALSGFGVAFLVMLVPAMLIGTTFPLAGHIGINDLQKTGASTGRIYAINTIGNILGALLPGFFLLSWLGIQKGILAMATINILLGFVILFLRLAGPSRHPAWRLILPVLLLLIGFAMVRAPVDFQFPSEGEFQHHQTLFYREGPSATTKVFFDPRTNDKHMSVDGIVIGGTGMPEFKQLLLAHLPKLLIDDVSTELSVGVGSGILMGESLRHPGVKNITGVEIEPGVVEGAGWFADENHDVLQNRKLQIVEDDIGSFLRTHTDKYKVITADEKTADEYASNGFSYSLEYYELLNEHLDPDGLVAQWIPTTLPPDQYRMILKTFATSFPHVQLWYFLPAHQRGPLNSILIGSKKRIDISYERISRQLADNPDAFQSLEKYGLTSAEAILPHFIADDKIIRDAVATANLNSLEHPRYEFYYPWDYAAEKQRGFLTVHEFIIGLKKSAYPDFWAELKNQVPDSKQLQTTFSAETLFLIGFGNYLKGMTATEAYRMFDYVLSIAPWNDSLRARIYSVYIYTASNRRDPRDRARLMQRAKALYENR